MPYGELISYCNLIVEPVELGPGLKKHIQEQVEAKRIADEAEAKRLADEAALAEARGTAEEKAELQQPTDGASVAEAAEANRSTDDLSTDVAPASRRTRLTAFLTGAIGLKHRVHPYPKG